MTEPETQTWRQRALMALAAAVCNHALLIVFMAFVAAGGAVWLTVAKLEFITDRNALVDRDAEFNRRFIAFEEAFGDHEYMMLMVAPEPGPVGNPDYYPDAPDADQRAAMKRAAAEVARRLRLRPDLFPRIIERVPPDEIGDVRLLYLPVEDLEQIVEQVQAAAPILEALAQNPGTAGLLQGIRAQLERGGALPDGDELQQAGAQLAQLLEALRDLVAADEFDPAMPGLFEFRSTDPNLDEDGYFFSWGGRLLYMPMQPVRDPRALNQIQEPLDYAREVVADVEERFPGLVLGLAGRPVIYSDEMVSSSRGMAFATIFAVFAVGLLFVVAFRSARRPLLAVLALILALCWTFGATTLLIGHLNIFAMVFAVVLVGLGIDFGIHLLNHYRQGLLHGLSVRDALFEVYAEVGSATVLGAVTTAAAVSTAAFTDFQGLAELGIICGVGIGFCLLAMLIVFPAMLVLLDAHRVGEGNPALREVVRNIEARSDGAGERPASSRFARWSALAVLVLVLGAAGFSAWRAGTGWVPFDYNLLRLNDPTSAAVHWEDLLIRHDQRSSYAVSVRDNPAELANIRRELQPLIESGLVHATESLLPEAEPYKRQLLGRIHAALPDDIAERPARTSADELRTAARRVQAALRQITARGPAFEQAFGSAGDAVAAIVAATRDNPELVNSRLRAFEPEYFGRLLGALRELNTLSEPGDVEVFRLPREMRERFVGRGPRGETLYAMYIYPSGDTWEREQAIEFNQAVLAVDPLATGITIQVVESGTLIVRGFMASVLYAFIAILVLLFVDLRRPLAVLLALTPLFCSMALLLGVMTLTGLSFNFANFFGVPILIGVTVDAGVYLIHSQRHGDPRRTLRSTRRACLLCGFTTLLGFGALMTASHMGVVSLGQVLVVGSTGGLLGSVVIVPAILAWFNQHNRRV
jgi:uncharacterized protein